VEATVLGGLGATVLGGIVGVRVGVSNLLLNQSIGIDETN